MKTFGKESTLLQIQLSNLWWKTQIFFAFTSFLKYINDYMCQIDLLLQTAVIILKTSSVLDCHSVLSLYVFFAVTTGHPWKDYLPCSHFCLKVLLSYNLCSVLVTCVPISQICKIQRGSNYLLVETHTRFQSITW